MASLYRRATPSQQRILRAVEGAIKNASDAHPEIQISPQHRRSIAKRAAGTLTAQWPDVLAASRGSSESGVDHTATWSRRQSSNRVTAAGREANRVPIRFPLRRLIAELTRPLRDMKLAGQTERAEAVIDVLRLIDRLRNGSAAPANGVGRAPRPPVIERDKSRDEPLHPKGEGERSDG